MIDAQLTHDFWLREFLRSQVATRIGHDIEPTLDEVANIKRLCTLLLQPIRDSLGRSITITSGLRPVWLNTLIGGAPNSEHIYARAADFIVQGMTPYAVTMKIASMNLPFNQLIFEKSWSHISVAPEGATPKREILTAHFANGRVTYTTGVSQS